MDLIPNSSADIIDFPKRTATSEKLDWMDAVMADRRLGVAAKVVAFCIRQHVNQEAGTAYVSDLTISHKTGVGRTKLKEARKDLRAAGWMTWKRIPNEPNLYAPLTGPMADIAAQQRELKLQREEIRMQRLERRRVAAQDQPPANPASRTAGCPESRTGDEPVSRTGADIHLRSFPLDEPLKESRYMPATDSVLVPAMEPMAADFETFWQQYPRKVGKIQAEKIYSGILKSKKASATELLAGAGRYAAAMASQQSRFIKHPGTWLNAGCWMDEPEPAPKPAISTRLNGVAAGMRGYFEDRYNDKE